MKLLEENIGSNLLNISFDNEFFELDTASRGNKNKNKQMGLHLTKKFLHSQENNKMKRHPI